ncbi:alpha/beta fold hydrolase [Georgenia sunbinii]|uniref:alpha/beta fold hydrolase n=1 Tax=Georgenia sunbinii TaxID=3117728 RepID=UPI002F26C223
MSPGAPVPPLPGLDPRWSRRVVVPGAGVDPPAVWHVLDNADDVVGTPRGTLLAVHGNPTWSYLWRTLLAAGAEAGWRVVAVDQLGMGYSMRDGRLRRLADRVDELGALTDVLDLPGPVVTVGHDWGGVVSLGWAVAHPEQLGGVVLTNTAIHHDGGSAIPALLRLAGNPALHGWATSRTTTFLRATLALARPALAPEVREGYLAPYAESVDRDAIADFVADIPATPDHPSHETLAAIAEGVRALDVPALLMWGPQDPVFQGRYFEDLLTRLPHADVHRFEQAGHLLPEDADVARTITAWLDTTLPADSGVVPDSGIVSESGIPADSGIVRDEPAAPAYRALTEVLDERRSSEQPAVVALHGEDVEVVSWRALARRVENLSLGLHAVGVRPGQRVSLLVPPGVGLTTALFACLRLGAVVVLADQGLGLQGMGRAIRGAGPDVIIGIERGLAGARLLSWPGRRIAADDLPPVRAAALGVTATVPALIERGAELARGGAALPARPAPDDDAAILFTSGSTGPAKGVVYTHRRLAAMRDALAGTYSLGSTTPFVAGFAPFALLGTALGSLAITPDMDVSAPATLTAVALARAVAEGNATAVFTSPAALRNVLDTADDLSAEHRDALAGVTLFLSAGAPIAPELLAEAGEIMPNAAAHTPYGMTEVLPVTDVDLDAVRAAAQDAAAGMVGAGGGTCVGLPVTGAQVRIATLDDDGEATGPLTDEPGTTGEIVVTAPHLKDRYDRLWATQAASADHPGWHRTGDVGHLDAVGRVWVEGRLGHVVRTPRGVLTPVAVEHAVERVPGVRRAAAVGVGPAGTEQLVIVLETDPAVDPRSRRAPSLATPGLTRLVRRTVQQRCDADVAAVLRVAELPTDVRHNAKIERSRLSRWAAEALAGGPMRAP